MRYGRRQVLKDKQKGEPTHARNGEGQSKVAGSSFKDQRRNEAGSFVLVKKHPLIANCSTCVNSSYSPQAKRSRAA